MLLLVRRGKTTVLVDTSPDLREQLLSAHVAHLDGVLMTHPHADQTNGIDDLRPLMFLMRKRVDMHADRATLADGSALENREARWDGEVAGCVLARRGDVVGEFPHLGMYFVAANFNWRF